MSKPVHSNSVTSMRVAPTAISGMTIVFRVFPSAPAGLFSSSSLLTLRLRPLLVRIAVAARALATKSVSERYGKRDWVPLFMLLVLRCDDGRSATRQRSALRSAAASAGRRYGRVCDPELKGTVGTLMLALSPLKGKPSKVHA